MQPLGDDPEHRIPRLVPAEVVDGLEAVEVHDEQREGLTRALGTCQRLLDPIVEERAVREPGQRVAERESLSGDQMRHEDVGDDCSEERERRDEDRRGKWAPVLGETDAEQGAKGDNEGSGRRPDQPATRSLPGNGLANGHVLLRPDARSGRGSAVL